MSYRGSGYRGPGDRSRSPARFDRRPSAANIYDGRHAGPPRSASDALPRGPRSQFDGPPRGPPPGNSGGAPRTLRDAPPLGTTDRGRPFRERDYPERRERPSPPPRERSPARKFNDFPPRDIDVRPARRSSRDGPLSAGSSYSETPPFSNAPSFRGGYRGRGRGDFIERSSTRGGRRNFDDRGDLFPRARSPPPPRYGRDLSRDGREPDRRDERRFERREDDRRPDWVDRERDLDRTRRDAPPGRLESRLSTDSVPSVNGSYQQSQVPPINPERLAIIESSGADPSVRRPSSANAPPPATQRPSEQPAFLTGRKDSTAHRYSSRCSSPPAQAPAVPAFSFSVAGPGPGNHQPPQAPRALVEARFQQPSEDVNVPEDANDASEDKSVPPPNASSAPKAAPATSRSPPPTAPKAPRALELDTSAPPSNRLQGVRSLESFSASTTSRADQSLQPSAMPASPGLSRQSLPHLAQPVSPNLQPMFRPAELSAPTGPKAVRATTTQGQVSPRPPFTSPRSDAGTFQSQDTGQRAQTPPPSAPSGPRSRSFSVSPKVATTSIPTAPKAARAPQFPPRAADRPMQAAARPPERPAMPPFAPSGPRSLQWNQWRRPGAPVYGEKPSIPAKRDANGDEKEKQSQPLPAGAFHDSRTSPVTAHVKTEERESGVPPLAASRDDGPSEHEDKTDVDKEPRRRSTAAEGHSARQSFFGKTLEKSEDEIASSSDEDELDEEEDATLLEAKHARKERELQSQMFDLGAREYRATSPLESIGRLVRFSVSELERINAQRDEDMDLDEPATDSHPPQPGVHSSESDEGPEIATPRGEDATGVVVREQEEGREHIRRVRRQSPEPVMLPFLLRGEEVQPLEETEVFQDNLKAFEETEQEVLAALENEVQAEDEAEGEAEADFSEYYRQWREECEDLDREKEEQERLERQISAEPNPEFDTAMAPPANPILEGRRLHKFNSEYEFEQVLKQSEETARIEQERQEREAKKKEADMEKEAWLPDQESESAVARSVLIDANRLREPTSLTLVFSYEPPADTFTEHEQAVFVAAFKDTPKKWGQIASLLPGRTYKDCIHHYYTNKWDGRFRDNKGKKFKGGRRGRGGKGGRISRGSALMADLANREDIAQPPTDSTTGRPKRAAAPTTFGEREIESKNSLVGQSPAKKPGPNGEGNGEKPAKKPRRTGERPGRKAKTQLAALAAAPAMSPNKQLLHSKEELARAQNLEDASLLANLQAGQGVTHTEAHMGYLPDAFAGHGAEELERPKPSAPVAKQGASSYWSVPEQTDFFKYIAHFGTDFGAIASHMGTKTQTMIKNHYQRQIDGGRADLEEAANKANARIKHGEDIGPPPTPTPIVKRKYDNPQSSTPRAIAPQTDAMNVDEPGPSPIPPLPKHASPPQLQYQAKPRYTSSAQSTPLPAPRVAPSPLLAATNTPANPPMPAATPGRGLQHPLGSRSGFMSEHQRQEIPHPTSVLRMEQDQPHVPSRSQPQVAPQQSRTLSNAPDPQFIQKLKDEQERALRRQAAEYGTDSRTGSIHGHQQPALHAPHTHGSPALQPLPTPLQDRKPILEERRPTPPGQRGTYPPPGSMRPSIYGTSSAQQIQSLTGTLPGRGPYHPSPPSHESSRPGSVPTSAPLHPPPMHSVVAPSPAPAPAPTPAPDPPKRSNLLSLLNDAPEEPKPAPKRDSLPSVPTRVASPAAGFPPSASSQAANATPSRRETFGQPSMPHSHFHRSPFGQPSSSTPGPPTSSLKHEHSSGSTSSLQQPPKSDWPGRMYSQTSQASPPSAAPALDRDGRPHFYPHRSSVLGNITQPSRTPPPHLQHSRTPSLTAQQVLPPRGETRSVLAGPPSAPPHQPAHGLHPGTYPGQQQTHSPYSQPSQVNRHAHNPSIERTSMLPPFGVSRDEILRRDEEARAAQHHRDREEQHRMEAIDAERRREMQFPTQRQREDDMERQRLQQSSYSRGPLPPTQSMHPGSFSSPFGQSTAGRLGLRDMAAADADHAMRAAAEQQRRLEEDDQRRRQQQQGQPPPFMREREAAADPLARRADEFYRRTTPHGGQGFPPPSGRR